MKFSFRTAVFLVIFSSFALKNLPVAAASDADSVAIAKKAAILLKDSKPSLAVQLDNIAEGNGDNLSVVYLEAAKALKSKDPALSEELETRAGEHAEDEMESDQKD